MARLDCPHEDDVLLMVQTGRWPERVPDELRTHAASCEICTDLASVAMAVDGELEDGPVPPLPSSGTVWWRAQLRARQDAAKEAVRPMTAAQTLGVAALFGLAGAVFGATAQWFQGALGAFGGALTNVARSVRLPSLPAMPDDLSSVWIGSWVIVALVAVGLTVGAAVIGWAMRED